MRILGLDFETTGLNVEQDQIIEIGAVLWETRTNTPLQIMSRILLPQDFTTLSEEVRAVTGIDDTVIHEFGEDPTKCLLELLDLAHKADAICAHNGNDFDKPALINSLGRYGISTTIPETWIDTRIDIDYPKHFKSRSLGYLAADHGFINPFPHRAVTDVLTMLKLLSNYDISEVIERAKSPNIRIVAQVSFAKKQLAKECGFYWDGDKKEWFKDIKEMDFDAEKGVIAGRFPVSAPDLTLI